MTTKTSHPNPVLSLRRGDRAQFTWGNSLFSGTITKVSQPGPAGGRRLLDGNMDTTRMFYVRIDGSGTVVFVPQRDIRPEPKAAF
jgi:hypothetical protein